MVQKLKNGFAVSTREVLAEIPDKIVSSVRIIKGVAHIEHCQPSRVSVS